jgi:vacuolar-type H+-ATPase subunit C/Vma6
VPTQIVGLGAALAYAQLHTVVRARYAKLLTSDIWHRLIQAQDFDAVLAILQRTVYADHLMLPGHLLTPRRVAYEIRWHLAENYTKIIQLSPEPARTVVLHLWHHYEVDNLKAGLRGVETGATWDRVLHLLYPMDRYISVTRDHIRAMLRTGDMADAIEALSDTPYDDTLNHALVRYQQEQTLFPLEMALDLDYRRGLWERLRQLKGRDRKPGLVTLGTILDIDNLLWALRFRIYHRLSIEEIINYTLAEGYEVREDDIEAIAGSDDIPARICEIYPDLKDFECGDLEKGGLRELELQLDRLHWRRCQRMFSGYPFTIGIPLAYVWLNEYEIRDLTLIIEAKALDTPLARFASMLITDPARRAV